MRIKTYRYFVGDFETTVFDGQKYTEVWASALTELFKNDDVKIVGSIDKQFDDFVSLDGNIMVYYHNLKFDGSFWLPFLIQKLKLKQAYEQLDPDNDRKVKWIEDKYMKNNTFKYSISEMGQWYNIIIKIKDKFIEIRDSYKLLPFSLERIGHSFKTKHKKLEMEYKGFRYANCPIPEKDRKYIRNDVLVLKEVMELMFNQGHDKLTIGACCLTEYKKTVGDRKDWETFFPNLLNIELEGVYEYKNAEEYIRKSYRGGWCYVAKGKEKIIHKNGCTIDVNSLYPSVMHSDSGNKYPLGKPNFWKGNIIPDNALQDNTTYFIRIKTNFYLKPNMLPFIQIKNNFLYKGTEMLETSDIKNQDGEYVRYYTNDKGELIDTCVTLTLTKMDYELMLKHYELVDFEILDGCWFFAESGIFDEYIDKYKEIKMTSEGAVRENAKLFLNNLYGKMASSDNSSFKVAYEKEDGSLSYFLVNENEKDTGFIPVGSFITSYARKFTIDVAQLNYDNFIYADTDSVHADTSPENLKGVKYHEDDFNCWGIDGEWDIAYFTRQKTYIERIVKEKGKYIDPYYLVKCAGMPDSCKELFIHSLNGTQPDNFDELTDEQKEFINKKRKLSDLDIGLKIFGKLEPKRIRGGILLTPGYYTMH